MGRVTNIYSPKEKRKGHGQSKILAHLIKILRRNPVLVILTFVAFTFLLQYRMIPATEPATIPVSKKSKIELDLPPNIYKYNICNGLSNQLIYHAIGIVQAIREKRPVAIYDAFIYNGVQSSPKDVLPSPSNSVALTKVFDVDHIFKFVRSRGAEPFLVPPDWDLPDNQRVPCIGMKPLDENDAILAKEIMLAFRPYGVMKEIIDQSIQALV